MWKCLEAKIVWHLLPVWGALGTAGGQTVWLSLHPGLEGEGKKFTLETSSPFCSSLDSLLSLLMKGQLTLGSFAMWHLESDQDKILSSCYTTGKLPGVGDSLLHVSPTPCYLVNLYKVCVWRVIWQLFVYPRSSFVGLCVKRACKAGRVENLGPKLLHWCFLRACRSLPPFKKQVHRELVPHDDSLITCWPEGLTNSLEWYCK